MWVWLAFSNSSIATFQEKWKCFGEILPTKAVPEASRRFGIHTFGVVSCLQLELCWSCWIEEIKETIFFRDFARIMQGFDTSPFAWQGTTVSLCYEEGCSCRSECEKVNGTPYYSNQPNSQLPHNSNNSVSTLEKGLQNSKHCISNWEERRRLYRKDKCCECHHPLAVLCLKC